VHSLGDPDAARATLRIAEAMLTRRTEEGRVLGFEWAILAGAFSEALADRAEVVRTLTTGWDVAWGAHDVENLGRVVRQWSALVDHAEAIARLKSVEDAALGWGNLGGVIYWWHTLGDAEAGRRARARTLATAKRFDEVLRLVKFWDLHEKNSPGIEAALARAESLAKSPWECFELAQVSLRSGAKDVSRRALDRAAEAASDVALKVRIAAAYVDWFRDETAADRVGPRGVPPNELRPRTATLAGWEGSASGLFDWLCDRMTTENLARIAEADRGEDRAEHLAALEYICKTRRVPFELAWYPCEVLALTRWSSHDGLDHMDRAFSCTLLLLASSDIVNTGPILVESCLSLGEEPARLSEQLFVWRYEIADAHVPDALLSIFLLMLLRAAVKPEDTRIADLVRTLAQSGDARSLREWMADSQRSDLWSRLIGAVLPRLRQAQPPLSGLLDEIGFPQ
jgi:hypothetical protein